MMANKHRGEVVFELGGRPRLLRPTFGALAQIELAAGRPLMAVALDFAAGRHFIRDVVSVIGAGMNATGTHIERSVLGDLLIAEGLLKAYAVATEFLLNAVTAGRDSLGEEDDPPGEAPAAGG